jgi:hypothetical protein
MPARHLQRRQQRRTPWLRCVKRRSIVIDECRLNDMTKTTNPRSRTNRERRLQRPSRGLNLQQSTVCNESFPQRRRDPQRSPFPACCWCCCCRGCHSLVRLLPSMPRHFWLPPLPSSHAKLSIGPQTMDTVLLPSNNVSVLASTT